ncbi:Imm19 family immunity protein [Bacteroides xylanisolvens]|nr:Imm19 family immunity protein [Bacteroides xylanisolvens]
MQEIPEIGTICTSNHSYRNALVYDDDVKLEIKDLNALLSKL